ncbi:MAG: mechanosensitive ion channel [Desulfobacterales bacterium]|nr:mechanosensitive ion channel [Desulfobacterales bacterium]
MFDFIKNYETWMRAGIVLFAAVIVALVASYLLIKGFERLSARSGTTLDNIFFRHCRGPFRWLILVISLNFFMPLGQLTASAHAFVSQVLYILLILSFAWLVVKVTGVMEEFMLSRYRMDVSDNLRARAIQTQIRIIKRIILVVVGILTFAVILMTFSKIRQIGTSILASAGIVGIIVGFAAQRSISTLLAGIQIAFTQPIRIDDVVIVENEWGRIEEITLTYVVVRIWDLRRLIVPITYFMEKPFQNWTRTSADILGPVFLYVDYTVPVQAVREELYRILKDSPLWDGKVWGLQTTNASERTVELRALMSAADASNAWNLRCEVREKLIEFIQKQYPHGLPRVRAEVENRKVV